MPRLSKWNRLAFLAGILFVIGMPTISLVREQIEREQVSDLLWSDCKAAAFSRGSQINDPEFRNCVDRNVGSLKADVPRMIFRDFPLRALFATVVAAAIYGVIAGAVFATRWVRRGS